MGEIESMEKMNSRFRGLFGTVMRDLHFWIPLAVLLVGLLFLRGLR